MKKAILFSIVMAIVGAIGGYLIGMYTFSYYADDMRALDDCHISFLGVQP